MVHILGVTERPVEAPSSPFGGARSLDSVPIPLFQPVSELTFSETSIGSNLEPQKSTKEGEEALFRCSGGPKMEAPEAALDPFRTVSLGSSVNKTFDGCAELGPMATYP
jgi:hypothetical protein